MNDDQFTSDQFSSEDEFPDELISAYLDDELSPEEKTRVEEQLMDSAEHRHLFEELKSLRHSLRTLPKESLDGDFAARVLERAEKQLLCGEGAAPEATPVTKPAKTTVELAPRPRREYRGAWRGLIWSVTAMVAAILLIVFSPMFTQNRNQRGGDVAVIDPTEGADRSTESSAEGNRGGDRLGQSNAVANKQASPLAAEVAKNSGDRRADDRAEALHEL